MKISRQIMDNMSGILPILRHKKALWLGFTLVELLISIAILGTLAGMAMIGYNRLMTQIRNTIAIGEIAKIEAYIDFYFQEKGELPETLDDLGMGPFLDPWGNKYQYHALDKVPKGKWRKDRFLVPLNTDYDLWSMGPDGRSVAPITSMHSRDDIIRANDGGYIGPASEY